MPTSFSRFASRRGAFTLFLTITSLTALHAQNYVAPTSPGPAAPAADSSAAAIASMQQDILGLQQQVSRLSLTIDSLQQQNADLRKQIISQADLNAAIQNAVSKNRDDINKAVDQAITTAITQSSADLRKDILTEVTKQIEALARDTNDQLQSMAKSINKAPPISRASVATATAAPPPSDMLVTTYIVKSGDTVSKIEHDFKVSHAKMLQANGWTESDADKIRAGQKIAIPVKDGAALPATTN